MLPVNFSNSLSPTFCKVLLVTLKERQNLTPIRSVLPLSPRFTKGWWERLWRKHAEEEGSMALWQRILLVQNGSKTETQNIELDGSGSRWCERCLPEILGNCCQLGNLDIPKMWFCIRQHVFVFTSYSSHNNACPESPYVKEHQFVNFTTLACNSQQYRTGIEKPWMWWFCVMLSLPKKRKK